MKIWPPRTLPPKTPIARRHRPKPSSRWTRYRACLRWDFGFTCPFCLLHEADLYGGPGEGLAGTTVEHRIARSADPSKANVYGNCLYACRFCNRARSAAPLREGEARLLDPTRDAWGSHFTATGSRLLPAPDSRDAEYTHRSYEIDDPRKVVRRALRHRLVTDRLELLRLLEEEAELLQLARAARRDPKRFGALLKKIRELRRAARRALEDLGRYEAVPADAPQACRCGGDHQHSLPAELERQLVEVPDTPG